MNMRNNVILNTLDVPIINNFEHLAERLSLTPKLLYMLSNKKVNYYSEKLIPKKNGSLRTLHVPHLSLKVVQKWILKEILEKIKVSPQAMAFVPRQNGLRSNAECHTKNIFLLEMDIKDFFGSIKIDKVIQLFRKIGYNASVSSLLANLCTFNDELPQGAVTSPYIANLVAYHLDSRLNGLCGRRDIVYTRYADDLSFSSNNRLKLNCIEKIVMQIVLDEGFEINHSKTRYLSNDVRKTITGITINNGGIYVSKELKKKLRAMIYNSIVNQNYSQNKSIMGTIAYINSIEDGYGKHISGYVEGVIKKLRENNQLELVNSFNKNNCFHKHLYTTLQ